ncbi:branched-chain amino acid transport system ATP-binding protein [Rhizobium sp. SG_E_25_P2]|uniref:ABC transporter ATP-binding protein n=1 Tax=Rhizobium sp. SG_E_25_P2 TaxID=2879942 RepID=UPI00247618A9|nr:ABC transporter ATP-binding protein [Rhizobium sp. SG_E_25_P2]MDH6267228.1 branched-chain amino acid transport system ATP-binding protein [Rhizobium sp. SG_E_25_P2]
MNLVQEQTVGAVQPPVLAVVGIEKSYGGGPRVLSGVEFAVPKGELLGVIGPNGSGKTTLFGVVSGQLRPDAGSVLVDGEDVTRLSAAQRACKGVGRTFQVPQSFQRMSVYENLLVGARFAAGLGARAAEQYVLQVLKQTGFANKADMLAGNLPLLDRKRLELARALATRPKLLLLDEIAGGLTDDEAHEIAATVAEINKSGVTVIWIEHLVHVLTSTARSLIVLGEGRILAQGEPGQTMATPTVRQLYLGMEPEIDGPLCP